MAKVKLPREDYNIEAWRDFMGKVYDRITGEDDDKTKKIELNSFICLVNQAALWDWEAYVKAIIMPQYNKPDWQYKLTYYADTLQFPDLVTWFTNYKNKQNAKLLKLDPFRRIYVDYNATIDPLPEFPVSLYKSEPDYSYLFCEINPIVKAGGVTDYIIRFMDQRIKTDAKGVGGWRGYVEKFIKENIGCRMVPRPLPLEWASKNSNNYKIEVLA